MSGVLVPSQVLEVPAPSDLRVVTGVRRRLFTDFQQSTSAFSFRETSVSSLALFSSFLLALVHSVMIVDQLTNRVEWWNSKWFVQQTLVYHKWRPNLRQPPMCGVVVSDR